MSHITLAQQGLAAVEQRKWDEALPKLTKAVKESANPAWLLARSRALVGVGRFAEALDDADLAWHAAYERNKRPLMGDAHYRRAVAYLRLGRPADADCCCVYAMRLAKGHSAVDREDPREALGLVDAEGRWTPTVADARAEAEQDAFNQSNRNNPGAVAEAMGSGGADSSRHTEAVKQWRLASTMRLQALSRLEQLPADDPARKVTATQKPPKKALNDLQLDDKRDAKPAASSTTTAAKDAVAPSQQPAAPKPAVPSDTPLRLQEFQNDATMSVSIFSKGNSKDNLKVEFLPFQVRVDPIIYPSGEAKAFTLDLWGEIDTAASKHTVTPSKVELSLKKKTAGKWAQLKGEAKAAGQENPAKAQGAQV
jgi:suppressor of G2 allele of SKP1